MSTGPAPLPPQELVRRICAGERQAETELVEQFAGPLRYLLARWTRDEATAEDLLQETLRLALEKIRTGAVREPDRLAGFLRGLAKNLSIDLYRRAWSRAPVEPMDRVAEVADDREGPLSELLKKERADLARRLLSEMGTDRDRQVLFRFYIAEESTADICRDLELAPDHFYRVLHRARQRFRRLWEQRVGTGAH